MISTPTPTAVFVALVPITILALSAWNSARKREVVRRMSTMTSNELLARFDIDTLDKDDLNIYAREYMRRLEAVDRPKG